MNIFSKNRLILDWILCGHIMNRRRKSTPNILGVQVKYTKYSWCSKYPRKASIRAYERGHLLQIRETNCRVAAPI